MSSTISKYANWNVGAGSYSLGSTPGGGPYSLSKATRPCSNLPED